jgi:hypothetical protein
MKPWQRAASLCVLALIVALLVGAPWWTLTVILLAIAAVAVWADRTAGDGFPDLRGPSRHGMSAGQQPLNHDRPRRRRTLPPM